MVKVTWFYGRTGPGQVADIVSHLPGMDAALRAEAAPRAAKAAALLDMLPKERTGDSQVVLTKGDLDYRVEIRDPDGKGGAAGIESQFHVLGAAFS